MICFEHTAPSGYLLREGYRYGVLQMRSAALDDTLVLCFEAFERVYQRVDSRQQLAVNRRCSRDVHGGGEGVVRALRHIHVVVGVQELFACYGVAAVGYDLVDIHVALGARARLPYGKGEFIGQLPFKYLVTRSADRGAFLVGHFFGL